MKKTVRMLAVTMLLPAVTFAAAPDGYYSSLAGKKGASLKQAVKAAVAEHTVVSYNEKTWIAFETTDVRTYNGQQIWFDIYSNNIVATATGHPGLDIEHSVPKSWWGGTKNEAYQDLVHLNPSSSVANNQKKALPLGIIAGAPAWTNGITSVGKPTAATGGGSSSVFEPADEYKGDFARAYFYVFTVYNDLDWGTDTDWMYDGSEYPTLKPWAYEMLLEWAANDPVDSREIARNDAIFAIQKNRNPFIDLPELAEFIWGTKKDVVFSESDITVPVAVDRPSAPSPEGSGFDVTAVDGYSTRWWDEMTIRFTEAPFGGSFFYNVNGGVWKEGDPQRPEVTIPVATEAGEQTVIQAYTTEAVKGLVLQSPVMTLTMVARNPDEMDYKHDRWKLVETTDGVGSEDLYVIVASTSNYIMSPNQGSGAFIEQGPAVTITDNVIDGIPESGAVVNFEPTEGGYLIHLSDVTGKSTGYLNTTAAKKINVKDTGTPATVSIDGQKNVLIDFGESLGKLQYNKQALRFVNYTSNQEALCLYVRTDDVNVGVEEIEGCVEVTAVYTLTGVRCDPSRLQPGIYIFVRGAKATKEVVR